MTSPQHPDLQKKFMSEAVHPPATDRSRHTGSVRASDAEREDMVERLRQATAEGRLTLEELSERCEVAYLAGTRAELAEVGEGLPEPPVAPAPDGSSGRPVFRALFGDVTHHGPGLEDGLEAVAVFGDVTLDLCTSPAPSSGELTIVARALLGDVRLLLPQGVRVEVDGSSVFGDIRDLTRPRSGPDTAAVRIRVTGSALIGDIVLAHPGSDRRSYWRKWLDERRGPSAEDVIGLP
ncbi:DUF1707 domain-containing protein [Streptomyces sp. NPDC048650]|uniref:DUF1707 SHOCT-like domain-containing protein n=1 Tax=unclassified Streptomyces TaxID=2593676 RepID=UPI00371B297A